MLFEKQFQAIHEYDISLGYSPVELSKNDLVQNEQKESRIFSS